MSIPDWAIHDAVGQGQISLVEPLDPAGVVERPIYATEELQRFLSGEGIEGPARERIIELRADLELFISGRPVVIGGWRDDTYMKPLSRKKRQPGFSDYEVWEIRSLDPSPSIRVFGRFAQTNVFIATHAALRAVLGDFGSLEWRREIRRCKAEWRRVFPTFEPHSGVVVHDYISDEVVDLRDP